MCSGEIEQDNTYLKGKYYGWDNLINYGNTIGFKGKSMYVTIQVIKVILDIWKDFILMMNGVKNIRTSTVRMDLAKIVRV